MNKLIPLAMAASLVSLPAHATVTALVSTPSNPIVDYWNTTVPYLTSDTVSFAPTNIKAFYIMPMKGNEITIEGQTFAILSSASDAVVTFRSNTLFDQATFTASRSVFAFGPGRAVPEPSTWAMMLTGFLGLGYAALRRNQQARVMS